MKSLKLSTKIAIISMLAIIISSVTIELIGLRIAKSEITDFIRDDLNTADKGVLAIIDDWTSALKTSSDSLAENEELIYALSEKDHDSVSYLKDWINESVDFDFFLITDEKGNVLTGEKAGTNISNSIIVRQALSGAGGRSIEKTDASDFGIVYAAPVKSGSSTLGVVLSGYDLTNNSLVDQVSESYNVECTIFDGSTRVSSTLEKLAVGSSLENSAVIDEVLKKGVDYEADNEIDGTPYLSYYFPMHAADGSITGIFAIAKNREILNVMTRRMLGEMVIAIILLSLGLTAITTFVVIVLLKPLNGVKDTLKTIAEGGADLTKRIALKSSDEIGEVVKGFNIFSGKLQEIVKQLKDSKTELSVAGDDLYSSTEDTASAIEEIIANINSITSGIQKQTDSVDQTAGAVDEISSNIDSLNNMIENQSGGVSQASAAVEEMIGNISSVSQSMEKMSKSFDSLALNAQNGFDKIKDVNEKVQDIETQSALLQEANAAISSIAEQTNLLAMNAAIEAAHAGDAGKGFAVVADEIRKLSETSSVQSKTIGDQLNQIQDSINNVVNASQQSSDAFEVVAKELKETSQVVIQIKAAMDEQNEGSKQITDALKIMNDSTVEVKNASEEMKKGNTMILDEVKELQDATLQMKTNMDEMKIGAQKINETGAALNGIASKVRNSIQRIGAQVDLFKV